MTGDWSLREISNEKQLKFHFSVKGRRGVCRGPGFQTSPYPGETIAAKHWPPHLALSFSLITAGETSLAKLSLSLAIVKLCPQRPSVLLGRLLTSGTKLHPDHLCVGLPIKHGRKTAHREEIST